MKRSDLACRLDPTDPHVWRYKGISYGYVGDYISMAWCLRRAPDLSRPGEFVDVGSCVFLPAFLQEAAETQALLDGPLALMAMRQARQALP